MTHHRDQQETEGLCSGNELCVCTCRACGVQARLQLIERIEMLEQLVGRLLERSGERPTAAGE